MTHNPTTPVQDGTVNDIPDNVLLGRVMRAIRSRPRRPKEPRWALVKDVFQLGSTYAQQLCRKYGLDPDELV